MSLLCVRWWGSWCGASTEEERTKVVKNTLKNLTTFFYSIFEPTYHSLAFQAEDIQAVDIPSVVEDIPSVLEDIPAVLEDIPAVVEDIPAVVEDILPVVVDIPAVVGDTLVVLGDILAVVVDIQVVVEDRL